MYIHAYIRTYVQSWSQQMSLGEEGASRDQGESLGGGDTLCVRSATSDILGLCFPKAHAFS